MSTTLIATLGGLWALLLWGAADWQIARSSKKTDQFQLNLMIQLPGVILSGIAFWVSRAHWPSLHHALIMGVASLAFTLAFAAFLRAFSIGSAGVVAPAAATYPLFTLVLSAFFVGLSFSQTQLAIMFLIMAGVVLLATEKRDAKVSLARQHQATIFAVLAAGLWGVGNVIQNSIIGEEPWQFFILFIDIWMSLFAFIFLLAARRSQTPAKIKAGLRDRKALLAGSVYTVGSFGFYLGSVRAGSVIIPIVVSSASPLVTSAMARIFDQEKLTLIKRAGAVVVVAGIILLNLN